MSTLDGLAAVARMRSWSSYASGMCLEAVAVAYGNPHSIGPHAGDFPYALKAWNNGLANHPNDLAGAPAGAAGYLSPGGNGYGHVFLFAGRGQIVSTDTPSGGRVGITTVEALCKAWGRTYLGWQKNFIGYDVVNLGETYGGTAPASGGSAPANQATKDRQNFLNQARGENLTVDGVEGAATKAAYQRYQTFLRGYGYTGAIDGIWGAGTQTAHDRYYQAWAHPAASSAQVTRDRQTFLDLKRGEHLTVDGVEGPATKAAYSRYQQFLRAYGYTGAIDGVWGNGTQAAHAAYYNALGLH